ncbi:hypothetical protein CNYM01_08975 [Colletotrichum nymphaeae SA-01]|uniref:Zn(2)-C6 fungal-type domain-containing protein n=1 Tax=Colletotrichum nymphaeae SA-01 TaxID=1460502 RepID=A0A135UYE0_9PEZI|nr:hypothetical protein CNYM01_08975 [Colletotrichum nymphaeae SA-01]
MPEFGGRPCHSRRDEQVSLSQHSHWTQNRENIDGSSTAPAMSRTRSGCLNCKRRHRKCDEGRPQCLQCIGQGVECEGYQTVLRWGSGIASRGRFAGALVPVEIEAPPPVKRKKKSKLDEKTRGSDSLAGEGSSGTLKQLNPNAVAVPSTALTAAASLGAAPSETTWPGRTEQDRRLLEESTDSVSYLTLVNETTVFMLHSSRRDGLFRSKLRQLAERSEALCAILLATHLYISNPDDPSQLFEEYYLRGLSLFRNQLESFNGSVDLGAMYAGLFICTLNLFQSAPWSIHLELMTTVYGLNKDLHNSPVLSEPGARFALELMGLMDMPTFVRGRSTLSLGIWKRLRVAQGSIGMKRGGIQSVSSLPRSLLDIFANIQDEDSDKCFLQWFGEKGEIPQIHLWEAYRLAGILTGRRLRIRANTGITATASTSCPATPSAEVLLGRLVASMDALCDATSRPEYSQLLTTNALLYPYVAARLEVAILLRQPTWMESLRRVIEKYQPYGKTANARNITEMLDEAWDSGDDAYDIDEQARRRNVEVALF